jgi:ATP/maltotriose-dependent transcriptional regulator MalT
MELVERDEFLNTLHSQFQNISESEEGHCMFIGGEAGIGKTSLIKTFCRDLKKRTNIYQGTCDALFTPRPMAPLYDILPQLGNDLPENSTDNTNRTGFFTKLFHKLSNQKETCIVIFEDIHWADEATLDFIKFLARRITQLKCLFILTYRDNEISEQHHLRNILGQLNPDSFTRMELLALSRKAVDKMAEEKGHDADNVYKISGGNPFYVNEILASYSPGVPDNIKDSILSVYNRQEEGTKNAWQLFSVIPEGLEINRFAIIKSSWDEALDHCFALKIIIIKGDRIIFKHELYRRTIENSLSPFKRLELNKKLLDLLLRSFEEEGEIERIVHYARNANENSLVTKYAPLAAKQAASLGAHIEAAKLFLMAIEYSDETDTDQLVKLYEAYAYECYLTNLLKDAIIYQGKALKIWQKKKEIEETGNSMRFLSRLWWFEGNRNEAEKYGRQAIEVLQTQPSSKSKAMAFVNMSQLKMFSDEIVESIEWGTLAIDIAKEIGDDEILCHALNNVGCAKWKVPSSEEEGKQFLMESLNLALKNSFHEHAARAYALFIAGYVRFKEYNLAKQFLHDGLTYCEERDLDSWIKYILSVKCGMMLETGEWSQAESITQELLKNPEEPAIIKIGAMTITATIKVRRGEAGASDLLQKTKSFAFETREHHRIVPLMIACLEYEWLTGNKIITEKELETTLNLVRDVNNTILNSEFAYWLYKARTQNVELESLYEPYQLLKQGKTTKAAKFWNEKGCPYEKAFALSEGNDDDKRNALSIFQQLSANAVSEKIKREMRAGGIKKIPRGLRESTKANPAQLTNRELDILNLLQKAAQNKEIAGTLFISSKTVDHHISSILFKLDVNSRSKAVAEAVRLGILK